MRGDPDLQLQTTVSDHAVGSVTPGETERTKFGQMLAQMSVALGCQTLGRKGALKRWSD